MSEKHWVSVNFVSQAESCFTRCVMNWCVGELSRFCSTCSATEVDVCFSFSAISDCST